MSNGRDRGLKQENKQYLGDGVYVGHDSFQLWITAEDGIDAYEAIALDVNVFQALVTYGRKVFGA